MSILKEVTEISVYAPVDIIEIVLKFFPIVQNVTIHDQYIITTWPLFEKFS